MAHELRIHVTIPLDGDAMARAKDVAAFEPTLDAFAEAVVRAGGDISVDVVKATGTPSGCRGASAARPHRRNGDPALAPQCLITSLQASRLPASLPRTRIRSWLPFLRPHVPRSTPSTPPMRQRRIAAIARISVPR